MIKIINGVYGYMDKNGIVKPKTEKDAPFALTEAQEARLVGLGVAKYVNAPVPPVEPENEPDEPEKPLEDMTAKELREVGKEYGLTFKVGKSKVEMVEAIKAEWPQEAEAGADAEDDAEDDGEPLPDFDPTEAVE